MLVADGVHRFTVTLPAVPAEYVNVYLVEGSGGSTLIDTGWNMPELFDRLCADIEADGLGVKDIARIVVTHSHVDHYGLAAKFKEMTGASILLHPMEESSAVLRFTATHSLPDKVAGWLAANGVPHSEMRRWGDEWLQRMNLARMACADIQVRDGDILHAGDRELRAIWTPGHSPGHICLLDERNGLLFSGDQVLADINTIVGCFIDTDENPLPLYLESLRKLSGLPVDTVLPSHGMPFCDLSGRARELRICHEESAQNIVDALDGASRTAYELGSEMAWNKGTREAFSRLPLMSKRLAIQKTLAYLEFLVGEGRARKFQEGGIVKFARAT